MEPPAPQGIELAADEVSALAARLDAAQAGITSSSIETYMTMRMTFPGEPGLEIEDRPFLSVVEVGDLAHLEADMMAFVEQMLDSFGGGPDPGFADVPPLEMIFDGDERLYVKLASLSALELAGEFPWLGELEAESGGDLEDLWGFADLTESGLTSRETLADLGADIRPVQDDLAEILSAGLAAGALLEAHSLGPSQVAGVNTEEYAFVVDFAALTDLPDLPDLFASVLGDSGAADDSSEGGALGDLAGSLPVTYTLHVDDDGLVWRTVVDLDLGDFLRSLVAGFSEAGEVPEEALSEFADLEFLYSIRLETLALNDPSLSVTLPDPSLVVALP